MVIDSDKVRASSIDDLAAYIVDRFDGQEVPTVKLQKLLYYCQAWCLGFFKHPIVNSRIEAWKHGPVFPDVYFHHRTKATVNEWPHGNSNNLNQDTCDFVDIIINNYGSKSPWTLRDMTHQEKPWRDAWQASNAGTIPHYEITNESIQDYFAVEPQ